MRPRKRKIPRRPWGVPRLDLSEGLRLVFRREVRLSVEPGPRVESTARAVLEEAGFEPVPGARSPGESSSAPSSEVSAWAGERWLPRRRDTAAATRASIITLFVAGAILGGLDAYISNSLVVAGYWILGAGVVALAFWVRYGRTYDTDLAMVTVSKTSGNPPPVPEGSSVVFWAARVRSQVQSGIRIPAGVTGPIWLAAELGDLALEFERRISRAGEAPPARVGAP